MDNNISLQVKKLIEVDKRAIELENKKEYELKKLEEAYKIQKDSIDIQLKAAKEDAKKTYEKLVQQAKEEAGIIESEASQRLGDIEKTINQEIEAIALKWWDKILNNLN